MSLNYKKILDEDASFQLVRTNPKLTGNVKLTVDSSGDVWMNSIDADQELSKNMYKRVAVDVSRPHPSNVCRFFNNGKTPSSIIYKQKREIDSEKVSQKYEDQYEFSEYYSGAKFLVSKQYDERMSYFAPLYLNVIVPDYFVIMKMYGAANYTAYQSKANYPFDNPTYFYDLMSNAQPIKVFDLTDKTKIGKYLRAIVSDPLRPKAPLTVNFEKDKLTTYNGVSVTSGVYSSKGEDMSSLFAKDYPLKDFERTITLGFERNMIIHPSIVNMEFLFDSEFEEYKFERYFGIYVSKIELDWLKVDIEKIANKNYEYGNSPSTFPSYNADTGESMEISNPYGVVLPISETGTEISWSDLTFVKENPFLVYVEDRDGMLYFPNRPDSFQTDSPGLALEKIRLSNKTLDVGKFYGPGETLINDKGFSALEKGTSYAEIKLLGDLHDRDTIKIFHSNGTKIDLNGNKYDEFVAMEGVDLLPLPGDTYYFESTGYEYGSPGGYGDLYYYNNKRGNDYDNANALAYLINLISPRFFYAYRSKDTVIVKCLNYGNYDQKFWIEVSSYFGYDKISVNGKTGSDLDGTKLYFTGGSLYKNRLVIPSEYYSLATEKMSDLLVGTTENWDSVTNVSKYVDVVTDDSFSNEKSSALALAEYESNTVLTLANGDSKPKITNTYFSIRERFKPKVGLLTVFQVKDFNYDFYSQEYNRYPVWEIYKYFYVPPDRELLEEGAEYELRGNGTITYDGHDYSTSFGPYPQTIIATSEKSYSLKSGDAFLTYGEYDSDGYSNPIKDESGDINSFEGYFSQRDMYSPVIDTTTDAYKFRDRFTYNMLSSEYHFYRENFCKDFAYTSKMAPYIVKWGFINGKDSRDNAYRLNASPAFGINNMSADQTVKNPNASRMTHEWFYLVSKYANLEDEATKKLNYTFFNEDLDLGKMVSDPDAFLRYFIYAPESGGYEISRHQFRYSKVSYNPASGYSEAMFKGAKFRFKEVASKTILGPDGKPTVKVGSKRYDGYKFTAVLRPVIEDINDDSTMPIRYRFIDNPEGKFILLLIEVQLPDRSNISTSPIEITHVNYLDVYSEFPSIYPAGTRNFDTINGDYRFVFDSGKSDLTYLAMYAVKSKKYDKSIDRYSNVKLSSKLDVSNFDSAKTIRRIGNSRFDDYDYNLLNEITDFGQKNIIYYYNSFYFKNYFLVDSGSSPINSSGIAKVYPDKIVFTNMEPLMKLMNETGSYAFTVPYLNPLFYGRMKFKQLMGGRNYFLNLFTKLSMAQFKEYVNSFDGMIEYSTVTATSEERGTFYAEILNTVDFTIDEMVVPVIDKDIPEQFKSNEVIGYAFTKAPVVGEYELNRYSGDYECVFRPVFAFNKIHALPGGLEDSELLMANVSFNVSLSDFAVVKNFWGIKVSDVKILQLQDDDKFNPVFEMIGEIAVDRFDMNLLTSNWEYGYHFKYLSKTAREPVHGFLRVGEDYSFLMKLLSVPSTIESTDLQFQLLDDISTVDRSLYQVAYQEKSDSYIGFINLERIIIDEMVSSGVESAFEGYVSEQYLPGYTLSEYVESYIKENVAKMYQAEEMAFYSKKDKSSPGSFELVNKTDQQLYSQGYSRDKNVSVVKESQLMYSFTINKVSGSGLSYCPRVQIKFI